MTIESERRSGSHWRAGAEALRAQRANPSMGCTPISAGAQGPRAAVSTAWASPWLPHPRAA